MRIALFIAGFGVCLAWPRFAWCEDTQTLRTYRAAVRRLALSADGKLLVTASYRDGKGELRIWDAAAGKLLRALEVGGHFPMSVAISPDSKLLISGSTKGAIHCWDVRTGRELASFKGHKAQVTALAFSPDGKEFASSSYDGTVRFWDTVSRADSGRLPDHPKVGTFVRHDFWVFGICYSPDGKRVARAANGDAVRQWERASLDEKASFAPQRWNQAYAVAYSPDSKILAAATNDTKLWLLEAASGKQVRVLKHEATVYAVAWSPDGKLVASGSGQGVVKLWEAETGKELASLPAHVTFAKSLAFSPKGDILFSGGGYGEQQEQEQVKRLDVARRKELPW
jgi:WD40 repeat protein